MKSFKGPAKGPTAFRNTFELVFLTKLSHAEVGVLMLAMDSRMSESQMIDGNKFLLGFFKLVRLQEKVLLGVITGNNLDITVFQQDICKTIPNKNKEVETIKIEEDDGFFASRGKKEVKPIAMVTKIMGLNPWVDWGIGDKAVDDGLHNRPATSLSTEVKEAYMNELNHVESPTQKMFSVTGDWLSLTSPVKLNTLTQNGSQSCPKPGSSKSRGRPRTVGMHEARPKTSSSSTYSRPSTVSDIQIKKRGEILQRGVNKSQVETLPAID